MRGEHFLLLAEREQLLPPAVLTQLRQILHAQKRPARGEAVARLLVDRGFLSVEQARRLVDEGSGGGSPLVPRSNPLGVRQGSQAPGHSTALKASSPLAPSHPPQPPLSNSAELILEPVSRSHDPPSVDEQKGEKSDALSVKVTQPKIPPGGESYTFQSDPTQGRPPRGKDGHVTPPPVVGPPDRWSNGPDDHSLQGDTNERRVTPPPIVRQPDSWSTGQVDPVDQASLSELSDSFSQWMKLPNESPAAQSPSPLFTPPGIKIPSTLIYIGLATVGLLLGLVGLMILTKLRAG